MPHKSGTKKPYPATPGHPMKPMNPKMKPPMPMPERHNKPKLGPQKPKRVAPLKRGM